MEEIFLNITSLVIIKEYYELDYPQIQIEIWCLKVTRFYKQN